MGKAVTLAPFLMGYVHKDYLHIQGFGVVGTQICGTHPVLDKRAVFKSIDCAFQKLGLVVKNKRLVGFLDDFPKVVPYTIPFHTTGSHLLPTQGRVIRGQLHRLLCRFVAVTVSPVCPLGTDAPTVAVTEILTLIRFTATQGTAFRKVVLRHKFVGTVPQFLDFSLVRFNL